MLELLHHSIHHQAQQAPGAPALLSKQGNLSYAELNERVSAAANGLMTLGVDAGERVAVYLPKQTETVCALFGANRAGAVFVPVNPLLKPRQVAYILAHCNVKVLVTSSQRFGGLQDELSECPDLESIVLTDTRAAEKTAFTTLSWEELCSRSSDQQWHRRIDVDLAAILYTSGSTGNPKGVMLSHRNMVAGARSVASYLENSPADRILAVLPLSFDAGLSQLTTAFTVGASVALMDYLLPRDVIRAVEQYQITGLAAVPPLWNQLVTLDWPEGAAKLRYITNTGGAMPVATTRGLQGKLPNTDIFLMYGLTEAFRSTYLPPCEVEKRPESMGKAIPNAEILVVNDSGELCKPDEPGELVHRGALVAMGYWNDPAKTAERFKPCPGQPSQQTITELAVWSGDQVKMDNEGYLYFISRKDDMIKTSGYRVSPSEVEEVIYDSRLVAGAAALGLPHAALGQAILLVVTEQAGSSDPQALQAALLAHCRKELPNYMIPQSIIVREVMPHNQNGKIDRRALVEQYQHTFQESSP